MNEDFTNYYVTGTKYHVNVKLKGFNGFYQEENKNFENIEVKMEALLVKDVTCKKNITNKINGVIGLGFLNQFTFFLNSKNIIDQHLISYSFNETESNSMKITLGKFENLENFDILSYCNIILSKNRIEQKDISCYLAGFFFSNLRKGFIVKNTNVTFSLSEDTEIILGNITGKNIESYDFFKNTYFYNRNFIKDDYKEGNYKTFLATDNSNVLKLANIGFIINNHVYNFPPDKFFENNEDPETKVNYQKKFKIKFVNNSYDSYIRIGKDLLQYTKTKLTINSEEGKVYFYTKAQIYFNKEMTDDYKYHGKNYLTPFTIGILAVVSIFVFNFILFMFYLGFKNKKISEPNYVETI